MISIIFERNETTIYCFKNNNHVYKIIRQYKRNILFVVRFSAIILKKNTQLTKKKMLRFMYDINLFTRIFPVQYIILIKWSQFYLSVGRLTR